MNNQPVGGSISVDLEKIAQFTNFALPVLTLLFGALGAVASFNFHFLTVPFAFLTFVNVYYLKVQKTHTLLSNFGLVRSLDTF